MLHIRSGAADRTCAGTVSTMARASVWCYRSGESRIGGWIGWIGWGRFQNFPKTNQPSIIWRLINQYAHNFGWIGWIIGLSISPFFWLLKHVEIPEDVRFMVGGSFWGDELDILSLVPGAQLRLWWFRSKNGNVWSSLGPFFENSTNQKDFGHLKFITVGTS